MDAPKKDPVYLAALPPGLREGVHKAVHSQKATVSANFTRMPKAVVRARVALIGDSAGCCHPLSASGLSSCTRDALELRRAVARSPDDLPSALQQYSAWRRGPQRTRISLAAALYQAFSERTPEMEFLRRGLFRYWKRSASGRKVSMALLSTQETRMGVMAREYARVVGFALPRLLLESGASWAALVNSQKALAGLVRSTFPYVSETVRDAIDSMGLRRRTVVEAESVEP
jgi:squalene monooxygenase